MGDRSMPAAADDDALLSASDLNADRAEKWRKLKSETERHTHRERGRARVCGR